MALTKEQRDGLDVALNEADLLGFEVDPQRRSATAWGTPILNVRSTDPPLASMTFMRASAFVSADSCRTPTRELFYSVFLLVPAWAPGIFWPMGGLVLLNIVMRLIWAWRRI